MAFKLFKKRWHKVTAIVLGVITVLVLILALFVNSYWSPILSSKVKEVVAKSSDGLYKVNFSSAELHVLRGTIDIFNVTLKPDTAVFNAKKRQNIGPNNLVELHVKRLTLSHIHPFKLYFQHKLDIGEVVLDEPQVNIRYQLNHMKDTVLKDNPTAWQKISKTLRSLHIGQILLGDIKLRYEDYSGNKLNISEFKEMNLSATDLLIDSTTQTGPSRVLYCKDIVLELNNYSGKSAGGLYNYSFKHLKLSTQQSRLNIEGLTLRPIPSDAFFAHSEPDQFSLQLDSLQLNNFDYLNYHKYRTISAGSLVFTNGRFDIVSNPARIERLTDRVVTYPNVGLYSFKANLKLDTVQLRNINVFYTEYSSKSRKSGTISFYNTTGNFLNITTRPEILQKNNICAVNLTSYFMGQGKLNVGFTFNLTDQDNSYTYKGSLGPMDLKAINPATMPITMVRIQSGNLNRMDFDISANRYSSHGKFLMLYSNVKVNLLRPDTVFQNFKSMPIPSLYANLVILKHSNPDTAGSAPRSFYVNFQRAPESPFFKFTWQTLLAGIKPSVGLTKAKQDQAIALVKQMAADKVVHLKNKQKRLINREKRRERRAQRKAAAN